jgi:hypothetical protein
MFNLKACNNGTTAFQFYRAVIIWQKNIFVIASLGSIWLGSTGAYNYQLLSLVAHV